MFYLRYKLYNLNNAMLQDITGDKNTVLAGYRRIANIVVFAQLWHTEKGFVYTIV